MLTLKLGCDPELFVYDRSTKKFVSAHDMIPGSKDEPYHVPCGAIQRDGVAAEFNIDPCSDREEFLFNINRVMDDLSHRVKKVNPDYVLAAEPVATFDKEYFDALPPEPKVLGCNPDFNAYTGKPNNPPHTTECFRTGAGHIHIGWGEFFDIYNPDHLRVCCEVVKQLDVILYPNSMSWDKDTKRRTLYGRMGSFRPKHYGVEYRPLSNAFLRDADIIRYVFDTTVWAVDQYFNHDKKYFSDNRPLLPEKYQ